MKVVQTFEKTDSLHTATPMVRMQMMLIESQDWKASCEIVFAYLTSFTSGDATRVLRNSGDSLGLEAWRRLHNENDPISSTRRVFGYVRNQTKCCTSSYPKVSMKECCSKVTKTQSIFDKLVSFASVKHAQSEI